VNFQPSNFEPGSAKHPLEWAREHPAFFFPDGKATSQALTAQLIAGVRALGSDAVSGHIVNEWSVVAAADDWFLLGQFRIPESLHFASLTPFPEVGQNSTRPEALIAAFASDIVVLGPLGIRVAKGTIAPNDSLHSLLARSPAWRRAVAFRGIDA
jgi:hypothetical protein